jgi:RDD family
MSLPPFDPYGDFPLPGVRARGRSLRLRRIAGRMLDTALVFAPIGWGGHRVSWHRVVSGPDDWQLLLWIVVIAAGYVWLLVVWPVYETISVASCARTMGKALAGVRVVTTNGERAGFGRALARALLVSWTSAAALTVVIVGQLRWPPAGLVLAMAWLLLSLLPIGAGHRSWLDAATGTEVVLSRPGD